MTLALAHLPRVGCAWEPRLGDSMAQISCREGALPELVLTEARPDAGGVEVVVADVGHRRQALALVPRGWQLRGLSNFKVLS
eukprot:Skav210831  [mRNA]  locus=scaffold1597:431422:432359:+ [translate_table: standard]